MSREGLARESLLNQQQAWKGKLSFPTQVKDCVVRCRLPSLQNSHCPSKIYPSLSLQTRPPHLLQGEAVVSVWWHEVCVH